MALLKSSRSFDHLHDEGLPRGHVESVDQSLREAEPDNFVDVDDATESQHGQREGLQHRKYLSDHKSAMAIPAVHPDSGEGSEKESGNLAGETDDAQQQRGMREPIDEPSGGDAHHPGADQRNALSAEKQPVIAMR